MEAPVTNVALTDGSEAESPSPSSNNVATSPLTRSSSKRERRWNSGRVLRVVRRVHMYLGIFLVPWLFLFGISGVLFNHPNVGEQVKGTPVPAARLTELTGFAGWNAAELAQRIVDTLNQQKPNGFAVGTALPPSFHGPALLTADSPAGRHTALVDVGLGRAFVISRAARPGSEEVPFKQQLDMPGISIADVERQLAQLLPGLNLEAKTPLVANPKIAPELRFVMRDVSGEQYNVTYNTGNAELGGRRADSWSPVGVSQFMGMLHTTHHFTPKFGARWLWAFFQDILGLAMAFWAVSGLAMWWQLKATRIAGIASIVVALGLAAWVMWGTASELMFGEVMQQLGPG